MRGKSLVPDCNTLAYRKGNKKSDITTKNIPGNDWTSSHISKYKAHVVETKQESQTEGLKTREAGKFCGFYVDIILSFFCLLEDSLYLLKYQSVRLIFYGK